MEDGRDCGLSLKSWGIFVLQKTRRHVLAQSAHRQACLDITYIFLYKTTQRTVLLLLKFGVTLSCIYIYIFRPTLEKIVFWPLFKQGVNNNYVLPRGSFAQPAVWHPGTALDLASQWPGTRDEPRGECAICGRGAEFPRASARHLLDFSSSVFIALTGFTSRSFPLSGPL